jgi:hypothetical protein
MPADALGLLNIIFPMSPASGTVYFSPIASTNSSCSFPDARFLLKRAEFEASLLFLHSVASLMTNKQTQAHSRFTPFILLTLSKAGWHASTPFATSKSIILTCKRE